LDASAVNTLIECIIRNTPILINKIPPVVEFLGENYPFYYTTFFEASQKATDLDKITHAHTYLNNMNKEYLNINLMINDLNKLIN
jgi:hypothetical protein